MAISGSYANRGYRDDPVFIGEVGLSGHVRPVSNMVQRIREAVKLGFTNIIMPDVGVSGIPETVKPVRVGTVAEAIRLLQGRPAPANPSENHIQQE